MVGGGTDAKPNGMTYISIFVVMIGAAMFGADQCNFGIAHGKQSYTEYWCPKFDFEVPIMVDGKSYDCSNLQELVSGQPNAWVTFNALGLNLVTGGMAIGAMLFSPPLSSSLGRRAAISIGGFSCFLGCIVAAYLSSSVIVYYIGRLLTGIGCGIGCAVLPMYQSEVATDSIRGATGSLFQLMVVVGGAVATMAVGAMQDWRQGFMFPGYAGILVGVLVWLVPESPRYVISRKGKDAGRAPLQRVRSGDVTEELDHIENTIKIEQEAGRVSWMDLFTTPGLRMRVFVACYMPAAQQLTGVNAFLGYQHEIFTAVGLSDSTIDAIPFGAGMILQWCGLVGVVIGLLLIDSSIGGRKKQLNGASFLMGPFLILGALTKYFGWSSIINEISVFVFFFGFQVAWGIVPWFYPAELFKMSERERALGLSTGMNFLINMIVGLATPILMNSLGPGTVFLIFGLLNMSNVIFVALFVKETKGVALEDIPGLFNSKDVATDKVPLTSA